MAMFLVLKSDVLSAILFFQWVLKEVYYEVHRGGLAKKLKSSNKKSVFEHYVLLRPQANQKRDFIRVSLKTRFFDEKSRD